MTAEQLRLDLAPDEAAPAPGDELADAGARRRIVQDLQTTLFVEAGAGSGKTHSLVGRILALVEAGERLAAIAAITFTEKAAAELRSRLRNELTAQADASAAPEVWVQALHELDMAAISTLHAFAQRLLAEHPIEAGLPPGVEVLDELGSQIDFDDRWEELLPRLLSDPAHEATLLLAKALEVRPEDLRALARELEANWDLLGAWVNDDGPALTLDLAPLIARCERLAGAAAEATEEDRLADRLVAVGHYGQELRAVAAAMDEEPELALTDLARVLQARSLFVTGDGKPLNLGNKRAWPDGRKDELVDELFAAGTERDQQRDRLHAACLGRLARVLARAVRAAAEDRRREGRLQFHDLLVHARRLLQDPEHGTAVRRAVRDRYRRLLIDEFQDTDPIQMELARLIGADPDRPVESGAAAIDPGRLFFVGDPKQSIYRFRRADIGVYLDAQRSVGAAGTVALVTNFRSTEPVLRWVNHVFAELIKPVEGRQPEFRPLVGQRRAQPVGPGVAVLGHEPIEAARAEDLRRAEAQQLVAAVATILAEGWTVDEPPRPATLGDICILLPTRTSLPTIERELLAAGIAYRAETANLVFASQEIRDLLLVARAIDDPTDALALVSALRSPAFGCGDDDLYTFRQGGGRFDHQAAVPAGLAADHPVAESLGWLAAAHTEAAWLSPSALLERIVRERRLLELAVVDGRQREVWRRLRFVVDQARAWSDTTGGSLRQFLRWAHLQGSESSRVAETVLPETDADAVRILTVHGAKGLEFPITILAGLTTEVGGSRRGVQVLWGGPDRAPAIAIRAGVRTADFATMAPLDEEMDDYELRRLLYVACTRACDHLVVSLCRRTSATAGAGRRTYAGLLAACGGLDDVTALDPRGGVVPAPAPTHARPDPVAPLPAWQAARQAALERAGHSGTVSATTVARLAQPATADPRQHPGLAKEPRDLDLAPWQKGRYGTAIGRAVHGVLQSIDLTTGAELQPLAAAQAAAEGVFGHEAQIERMVASALADPLVREAAASAHWRELFVAAPVGERLLEGYLDLLFRRADGLVIVDYKTDSYADETDLDAKLARYRLQMAAYAVAVEAATGQRVVGASLLFLAGARAVAVPVEDLPAAMAEAVAALPTISYGGEAVLE